MQINVNLLHRPGLPFETGAIELDENDISLRKELLDLWNLMTFSK